MPLLSLGGAPVRPPSKYAPVIGRSYTGNMCNADIIGINQNSLIMKTAIIFRILYVKHNVSYLHYYYIFKYNKQATSFSDVVAQILYTLSIFNKL